MRTKEIPVGISKAARELGWCRETLRRWADDGMLPRGAVMRSPRGHRRFCVSEIRRWLSQSAGSETGSKRDGTCDQDREHVAEGLRAAGSSDSG